MQIKGKELETVIQTIGIYSEDTGMECDIDKSPLLSVRTRKGK